MQCNVTNSGVMRYNPTRELPFDRSRVYRQVLRGLVQSACEGQAESFHVYGTVEAQIIL
jgi:hypothetical protein